MPARQLESQQERRVASPQSGQGDSQLLDPSGSLATRQVDEMVAAWRRGERPLAEDFLARHPELGEDAAIRLIYEEVCLRQEAGLAVDYEEIARRFPRWRQELEVLLDCQRLMESKPISAGVSSRRGSARGVQARARTRARCRRQSVPGGATLSGGSPGCAQDHAARSRRTSCARAIAAYEHRSAVLRARSSSSQPADPVHAVPGGRDACSSSRSDERSAREQALRKAALGALDQIQARLPITPQTGEPLRQFIAGCSYVEAICAIGACLADGLQYAHDRNLLAHGHQAFERAPSRRRPADAARFPPRAATDRRGRAAAGVGGGHAGIYVAGAVGRGHGRTRRATRSKRG